ncbi:Glycosidase, partial [Granulicatella balaenopterae]
MFDDQGNGRDSHFYQTKWKYGLMFVALSTGLVITTQSAQLLAEEANLPTTTLVSEQAEEPPIKEGYFRVHFKGLDEEKINDLGLWLWGGVANPSDGWPGGATKFDASHKSQYGYYIDIPQSQPVGNINYLLLDCTKEGDAAKITTTDQTISLLTPEMNQAFIDEKFAVHVNEPNLNENIMRIHYHREDNEYDDWGLWLWGDSVAASKTWPTDAMHYTGKDQYGVYFDVPVTNGVNSSFGFLVVNKDGSQQSGDMQANRKANDQIFIQNTDTTIFDNPYQFDSNKPVEPTEPGTAEISASASVNHAINSNESAILTVDITNNSQLKVANIKADLSAIGGGNNVAISPELNAITVSVPNTVVSGDYQIPVTVIDEKGGYYTTEALITINEREKQASEKDWDEQIIYFMVTDRFKDGNPANNDPASMNYASAQNQAGVYHGGDFKGVTEKLDYLKELGVTTIWVTPIVEQVEQDASYGTENGEYYAYHGYWAKNFEELNPHLGTLDEFHTLIDEAAERNINIMVDVVLNHAGYGMDKPADKEIPGFPSDSDRQKFHDMFRTENGLDIDKEQSLAGLPDFKTEDPAVRKKLVDWQAQWLEKAKTPKGNSIYGYRIDTVKHVDNTTWQAFKNALVTKDQDFHLIGESWGANYQDTKGHLNSGMMDSLLDFGFKGIAKQFIDGDLTGAMTSIIARNQALTSNLTLGQFLSSHDEDGFMLHQTDANKQKLAATLQITSKGQPVIYYGEELGQTGQNNWPIYTNRYDFDWEEAEKAVKADDYDMYDHYKKLLAFRNQYSELLSRGTTEILGGTNQQGWLVAKRILSNQVAYIGYNSTDEVKELTFEVTNPNTAITDHYTGATYQATTNEDGKHIVIVEVPRLAEGGTILLTSDQAEITAVSEKAKEVPAEDPIAEGSIRMHFKQLPDQALSDLGLWIWGDVETPSESVDTWPQGATSFSTAKTDGYGYYIDVPMKEGKKEKVQFLINNSNGDNLSQDREIAILSDTMNEAWIDEQYRSYSYEPLAQEQMIRINYYRTDGNYADLGVWLWEDVEHASSNWPDGMNLINEGQYGRYVDVPLKEAAKKLGFLFVNEKTGDKTQDKNYIFDDLSNHTQIFVKDTDTKVYTNPYYADQIILNGAEQISPTEIALTFTTLEGASDDEIKAEIKVNLADKPAEITDYDINRDTNKIVLKGNFTIGVTPYKISYKGLTFQARLGWQMIDSQYGYDGELGATISEDGTSATTKVWAPSAEKVSLVIYDKNDQNTVLTTTPMNQGEKGVWDLTISAADLGIDNLTGYYYHYLIERNGEK